MIPWEHRPVEIANLLNPAFCSTLLIDSIRGYQSLEGTGMPYALVFLVLPIVLHKRTREALPSTTRTQQHVWLQQHPEVRYDAAQRIRSLVPYTKEALAFGIQAGFIQVNDSGKLIVPRGARHRATPWHAGEEPHYCKEKANFLGRWLAKTLDVATIYTLWGIRP